MALVCQSHSSLTLLSAVGTIAQQSGFTIVLLYTGRKVAEVEVITAHCKEKEFTFFDASSYQAHGPLERPLLENHPDPDRAIDAYAAGLAYAHSVNTRKLKPTAEPLEQSRFRTWAKRTLPNFEHSNVWPLHTALAQKMANHLLCMQDIQPDVIVAAVDGISGPIELLSVARHLGIPVVTVPYGFPLGIDLEISLEQKQTAGKLLTKDAAFGEVLERFCPQWIKTGSYAGATMFTPEHIVALESLGVTLARPWSVLGDLGSSLCCESNTNRTHYLASGVPPDKLEMTGSPYCDLLLESMKADAALTKAFEQGTPIEPGRIKVLVSWPPSYHEKYPGKSEFQSYQDMVVECMGALVAIDEVEVTVSHHPAMSIEERALFEGCGVEISTEDIIALIPRHDVYFSFFSSTIRWAIAAGKIVLNYDMYQLNMDIYDEAPGVYTSASLAKMTDELRQLASSAEYCAHSMSRQQSVSADWGVLDGQCGSRILALGNKLIRSHQRARLLRFRRFDEVVVHQQL